MPDAVSVRDAFRRNAFCVIATASPSGQPWLSPVFYNYSADYQRIFWESAREAQHSEYVRANSRIAVFVKDTEAKGPAGDLYMEATAREVPPDGLAEALWIWQEGPHGHSDRGRRSVDDYAESKPLRLYEAQIERLYVLTETKADGYRVDMREEVDLASLRTP